MAWGVSAPVAGHGGHDLDVPDVVVIVVIEQVRHRLEVDVAGHMGVSAARIPGQGLDPGGVCCAAARSAPVSRCGLIHKK